MKFFYLIEKMNIKNERIIGITLICILLFGLYISQRYSINDIKSSFNKYVYSAEKKESSTSTTEASGNDMVELLARLINGEARGEPYEGQVAVGAVILNRVKSPEFPNTIVGVIYQKGQFSCVTDGQFDEPMEEGTTVYKAAQDAMNGSDPTNGALYFYNPKKTKSKWLYSLPVVATIGEHKFAMGANV